MGSAMESAMKDIKHIVGIQSDNEEMAEEDENYLDMSDLKNKFLNRKRAGSDESTGLNYVSFWLV